MTQQEILDLIKETIQPYSKGQLMSRQVAVEYIKDVRDGLDAMIMEIEVKNKSQLKLT